MKTYDKNKFRIANVGYLNSVPYRVSKQIPWVEYSEAIPAECSRMLHEGECDLACIPIAEFAQHGGYQMLPFGIVSTGAVESVFLLSEQPIETLERVFIDSASQTSVVLLRVLLERLYPERAKSIRFFRRPKEEVIERIEGSSGGLLIGDTALECHGNYSHQLDLGEAWYRETRLPFVFAVWAGRPEALSQRVVTELSSAFSTGLDNYEIYGREWADEHKSDRAAAVRYLEESISYELDAKALQGAQEFLSQSAHFGLLPKRWLTSTPSELSTLNGNGGLSLGDPHRRSLDTLLEDAASGQRLSVEEGIRLAQESSSHDLALASDQRRKEIHQNNDVSYIIDRNINYTNVCNVYCRFCAFYRAPGKSDGYILTKEQMGKKIQETVDAGGVQILLQGGLHPELGIEYYEDLFRWMKANYPINLHALSADEVQHICNVSQLSLEETLSRLIDAGMDSLPGGGAEILVDRIRHRIARLKTTTEQWLSVHRVAHQLNITSTSTMMFGVKETWEDRLLHLEKIRSLQDETGGFTAFITWPFQEDNTKLKAGDVSAPEYLRVQAISRLFLDNISNIQSSWVTQGPSIGQIALYYGANDFGSVMFEENVVSAAGTTYEMNSDFIERHILEAGFGPWRRDIHYNAL